MPRHSRGCTSRIRRNRYTPPPPTHPLPLTSSAAPRATSCPALKPSCSIASSLLVSGWSQLASFCELRAASEALNSAGINVCCRRTCSWPMAEAAYCAHVSRRDKRACACSAMGVSGVEEGAGTLRKPAQHPPCQHDEQERAESFVWEKSPNAFSEVKLFVPR